MPKKYTVFRWQLPVAYSLTRTCFGPSWATVKTVTTVGMKSIYVCNIYNCSESLIMAHEGPKHVGDKL
jgi:hypothetical protein